MTVADTNTNTPPIGLKILEEASRCWCGWQTFRVDRLRNKKYTYGDQWSDTITIDGVSMREEDYIKQQGSVPLKNNLIRRLVRNVVGVFRSGWKDPELPAYLSDRKSQIGGLFRENTEGNRLKELYSRTLEEFLISGMAVHKKWYGQRAGRCGCQTDAVSPGRFFIDREMTDCRSWDATIVGEIHDLTYGEMTLRFGDTSRFYGDISGERCRVIEVWRRTGDDNSPWSWYFITPSGHILASGLSPYPLGSHPYVFKAYPFIDGEVHAFVSDVIDQQRHTNRLITLYDWVMRSTAKGVLLFPEEALPDGVMIDDISKEWSRFDGVIQYRSTALNQLPQQVTGNAGNVGISELLNLQLKLFEDISGVNGALQGRLDSKSISGTLYDTQTRNALVSLADILGTYDDFISQCTAKDAGNLIFFKST